jgi:hypothetical protein
VDCKGEVVVSVPSNEEKPEIVKNAKIKSGEMSRFIENCPVDDFGLILCFLSI